MPSGKDMRVTFIKKLPSYHAVEISASKNTTEYVFVRACRCTNYT